MRALTEAPVTRRDTIASLLAMLALVVGLGETDAAESAVPVAQPAPSSTTDWESPLMLQSADESLPLRTAYLDARFSWAGDHVQLALTARHDRTGQGLDFFGTGTPVARFELMGDGAAFLDAMSSDADVRWERDERDWMQEPRVHCPVCACQWPERGSCPDCGRTGWVQLSPEEAKRSVEYRRIERQALIEAAVKMQGGSR